MPKLTRVVGGVLVEGIFELGVAVAEERVKFGFVAHGIEVEGLAGVEDNSLFGKVAIIRVVKAV